MIFQPDAVELIRARRKSQTRREWPECRVRVGGKYAVQPGRGKPGVLDITILAVRREALGAISQRDVRAEGFQFRKQFEQRWAELHGAWTPDLEVWVVTFGVGDLRDHFDQPRLLKATPGIAGDSVEEHQDYTTRPALAMPGEPEAVPAAFQKRLSDDAFKRDDARRRAEQAEKSRTERISELERRAADGDQNAKRHLRLIDRRIDSAERKPQGQEAA